MTPTANDLREVGLRPVWKRHQYRVLSRRNVYTDTFYVPHVGQRTLGEYWRRRRMVARQTLDFRRHMGSEDRPSQPIEVYATEECRTRRWKAWPKPGWSRKGKGQR